MKNWEYYAEEEMKHAEHLGRGICVAVSLNPDAEYQPVSTNETPAPASEEPFAWADSEDWCLAAPHAIAHEATRRAELRWAEERDQLQRDVASGEESARLLQRMVVALRSERDELARKLAQRPPMTIGWVLTDVVARLEALEARVSGGGK